MGTDTVDLVLELIREDDLSEKSMGAVIGLFQVHSAFSRHVDLVSPPSSKNSCFQSGTLALSWSTAYSNAAKASPRWGEDIPTITLVSPRGTSPILWKKKFNYTY